MKMEGDQKRSHILPVVTPLRGRGRELEQAIVQIKSWYAPSGPGEEAAGVPAWDSLNILEVTGKPGSGKTRFAQEILRRLGNDDKLLEVCLKCKQPAHIEDTVKAVIKAFRTAIPQSPVDWPALLVKWEGLFGRQYVSRAENLIRLLDALTGEAGQAETGWTGTIDRAAVAGALRTCLELAALESDRRLAWFIDDYQWVGEQEGFIWGLLKGGRASRCPLVVLAWRSGATEFEDTIALNRHRVVLGNVSRHDGRQILADVLDMVDSQAEFSGSMPVLTKGLPLYFTQYANMLAESPEGRTPRISAENVADARTVVLKRFAGLPPVEQNKMKIWAVARYDLTHAQVNRLHVLTHAGQVAIASAVAEAGSLARPVADGNGGLPREMSHDVALEAIYSAIPADERRALHKLVADEIAAAIKPGTVEELDMLPALCRHLEAAGEHWGYHVRCCELMQLLWQTGQPDKWDEWHDHAAGSSDGLSPYLIRVEALRGAGEGSPEDYRLKLTGALNICIPGRDDKLQSQLHGDLAASCLQDGLVEQAERHFEQAISTARAAGAQRQLAAVLANTGILRHRQGQLEQARSLYDDSLAIARGEGDRHTMAAVLGYLATLYMDMGRLKEARQHYIKSLEWLEQLGDLTRIACTVSDLGTVHRELGSFNESRDCYDRAYHLQCALNEPVDVAVTLMNATKLYRLNGRCDEALDKAMEAVETAGRAECPPVKGMALMELGETQRCLGMLDAAVVSLTEGRRLIDEAEYTVFVAVCDCCLSKAYAQLGRTAEARASASAARKVHAQMGSPDDLDLAPELRRMLEVHSELKLEVVGDN